MSVMAIFQQLSSSWRCQLCKGNHELAYSLDAPQSIRDHGLRNLTGEFRQNGDDTIPKVFSVDIQAMRGHFVDRIEPL